MSSSDEYLKRFANQLDTFITRTRSVDRNSLFSDAVSSIQDEINIETQLIPAIGAAVSALPSNTEENDILAANIDMGSDSQESVSTATTAISRSSSRMNENLEKVRYKMQTVLANIENALDVSGNERIPENILDQVIGLLDPSVSDIQTILFNISALEQTREQFKIENPGGIFRQLPDAIAQWGFDTTSDISKQIFDTYIKLLEKTIKYTPPTAAAGFSSILLMSLFSESTIRGLPISPNIKNMIMGTKYVIDSSSKTAVVAGAIAGIFKTLSPETELPRPRVPTPEEINAATELAENAYGNARDIGCTISRGVISCGRVAKSATKMLRDAIVNTTNVLGHYAAKPFRFEPAEARAFNASQSTVSSMTDNNSYRSPPGSPPSSPIAEELVVGNAVPIPLMEPASRWTDRLLGSPELDELTTTGSPIRDAYAYNEDDESSTNSNPRKKRRTTQGETANNFGGKKSKRHVKSKATKKRRYKMAKKGERKTKRRMHKRTLKRYRNKKRR